MQLVFDVPVFVVPGDRLIVRNAQGTRTVGGGAVLDPLAPERRRRSAERMQWLDALDTLAATGDARPLLAVVPAGLTRSALARLLGRLPAPGWAGDDAPAFAIGQPGPLAGSIAGDADELWLAPAAWAAVRDRITGALERHHARAPDEPGLNGARLQRSIARSDCDRVRPYKGERDDDPYRDQRDYRRHIFIRSAEEEARERIRKCPYTEESIFYFLKSWM